VQVGEALDRIREGLLVDLGSWARIRSRRTRYVVVANVIWSIGLLHDAGWTVISGVRAADDGTATIAGSICVQSRFHGFLLHQKCPLLLVFGRWH
jgi:hypothetical protein